MSFRPGKKVLIERWVLILGGLHNKILLSTPVSLSLNVVCFWKLNGNQILHVHLWAKIHVTYTCHSAPNLFSRWGLLPSKNTPESVIPRAQNMNRLKKEPLPVKICKPIYQNISLASFKKCLHDCNYRPFNETYWQILAGYMLLHTDSRVWKMCSCTRTQTQDFHINVLMLWLLNSLADTVRQVWQCQITTVGIA